MNFEELDKKMRSFEQSLDQVILPELYLAVRLDGRNFTKLTKEICRFEAPFDTRFRDAMIDTTKHLMQCGFRIVYGYTESDEISLLFHPEDHTFGRKTRKINSVLAGEASACMSLKLGTVACFDSRASGNTPKASAEGHGGNFHRKTMSGGQSAPGGFWSAR